MERIIKETKQHFIIDNPEKKKKKKNADIMQVDSDNTTYINNNFDKMKIESNRNASTTINFPNNTLENSNTTQIQNQPEAQDVKQFYIERENNILIHHYGPDLYNFSKELEEIDIKPTYLSEHKVDSHVRTKMIDWMIEVLYAYNCDTPTFYLAVHLLDLYISRSRVPLTVNDIHLSGICCIYIASKMEDIVPLRMTHVKTKIGHNKFTEKEIKKREKQILMEIDFEVISTSTYDFINTFILDFKLNNKQNIKDLDMNKHIDALSNVCIFLSKLVALNEEFTQYRYSLKAICCIVAGFDILRSNSKTLKKEMEYFIKEWIIYLITQSQYNSDVIGDVYSRLVELYTQFETMKYTNFNLNKTHSFFFY